MVKRHYPFSPSHESQQKTHVGTREMLTSSSATGDQQTNQVHNRTLALLYAGARSAQQPSAVQSNDNNHNNNNQVVAAAADSVVRYRQTLIDGFLNNGDTSIRPLNGRRPTTVSSSEVECRICHQHHHPQQTSFSTCHFCELVVCTSSNCSGVCSSCHHTNCTQCSLATYEGETGIVCFSCCSHRT